MENNNLETKLFEAAAKGCTTSLHNLLQQDPLLLDRTSASCLSDTPLHVAAMLGHVDFVKEIVSMKPELTGELNTQRSSALHLASAKGRDAVVAALLSVDRRPCLARDRNGLTPVHLAAAKGRVEAMRMLLRAQPSAARLAVYGGGNILHLCIGYGQLEALKVVVESTAGGDPEFVNSRDGGGNTVLHLAVAEKQVETIDFLLTVATLEVKALNLEGMTPMDVLLRSRRDIRDFLIKESLTHAGGHGSLETNIVHNQDGAGAGVEPSRNNNKNNMSSRHEWVDRKKDALMVVASLIATMNFQVGVSPPGGVWQEDNKSINRHGKTCPHEAGTSILAHKNPIGYTRFYIFNAIGFVASLSIILLLMSGLPIRRRWFMWFLMAITWVAITATATSYVSAVMQVTPSFYIDDSTFSNWMVITVLVWLALVALLFVGHTVRLSMKMVRGLVKTLRGRTTGRRPLA